MYLTENEKKALVEKAKQLNKVFDKEEIFQGCTVQVLTNTKTGEVSVGWFRPGSGWETIS